MTVRVSEYYDVFDVKKLIANPYTVTTITDRQLPTGITDTNNTNTFNGFSNWSNFSSQSTKPNDYSGAQTQGTANPANNIQASSVAITGQSKAPQVIANIRIDENGDIWCYPPNVSVPHWTKVIFRNYDYNCDVHASTHYNAYLTSFHKEFTYESPNMVQDGSDYKPDPDSTETITDNKITDYESIPVFLKFDEYPSRSKVIFSKVDKTRNPDIEFRFGYAKGQMEPIKVNLSFSCNTPSTDQTYTYNRNLTRDEIEKLFNKCYWSIEWVYERESGN